MQWFLNIFVAPVLALAARGWGKLKGAVIGLLQLHDTPESIARGVTIGLIIAMTPTVGIQMALVVIIHTICRANRLAGIAMAWLTNPITVPPVYWFDYWLGSQVYPTRTLTLADFQRVTDVGHAGGWWDQFMLFIHNCASLGGEVFLTTFIGGFIFGAALGLPLYPLTIWAVRRHRARRSGGAGLVLASASPRRRQLLEAAGLGFTVDAADVDETPPRGKKAPKVALLLARRKAEAVAARHPEDFVLGADTIVELEGQILGKPRDDQDAARILGALSGHTHRVITGIWLVPPGAPGHGQTVETRVTMRALSAEEIRAYVASGEGRDKAGAYAIQETGDAFVARLEGDYDNVVGLPVSKVRWLLEAYGWRSAADAARPLPHPSPTNPATRAGLLILLVLWCAACTRGETSPPLPAPPAKTTPPADGNDGHPPASALGLQRLTLGPRTIEVEVADTDIERQRGLMFRRRMDADQGMLFVFPETAPRHFWMRNTYLPLDLAYIDAEGRIVDILPLEPMDETLVPSSAPARWALEMHRGWFAAQGIRIGDRVDGL